jgi:cardiolipin synthase
LTDLIDGKIARHFNMITTVGKVLDPLADKITQFTLILCLAIRYPVLWILIGIFVVKEGFQLIAGTVILRKGKILAGALLPGKICTTILFTSLVVMVMLPNLNSSIIYLITAVDCVFLLISFISYIMVYAGKIQLIQDIEQKPQ